MILLSATTDKLQVISSDASDLDVVAAYLDRDQSTFAVGLADRQLTTITTATTTDIVAAPASGKTRNVKQLTIRNAHASVACDATVQVNANAVLYELHKTTLQPGEMLQFVEGVGFVQLAASNANQLLTTVEISHSQRVLQSDIGRAAVGTFLAISGTAYYVYVGRAAKAFTAAFVEFYVTTAGAGAQTAEVGLFSSTNAPNKTGQTLTKIVATGTVDTTTTTGVKRNTTTFAQAISAGTHLWAAARFALATTQPTCAGLAGDMSQGRIHTTTGGGVLTGLSTAAGTIPAIATATNCPDLRVVLD
jgi:hypothetical protein